MKNFCAHASDGRAGPERSEQAFFQSVFEGAWGTDIRAGVIGEIGCQHPWTALEKRVMRGALLAQARLALPGQRLNTAVADFSKPALVRCRSTMAVLQMRKQTRETRRSSTRRRQL